MDFRTGEAHCFAFAAPFLPVRDQAMRSLGLLGVLVIRCLLDSQQIHAQPARCMDDYFCTDNGPTIVAALPDAVSADGKLTDAVVADRCPESSIDVIAASPEKRHLACSAATDAIRLLGRCGIVPQGTLLVHIVNEVRHPFSGVILGMFDPKQGKALVTEELNIPSLVRGTPHAQLPQRDFYKSLIVHEVIHAVMHQNLKRPASSYSAYEYPAYALQIESLTQQIRDTFLQSIDQPSSEAGYLFNDAVLFSNPYYFAARAYRHFKASANGCTNLVALLEGEVSFIAAPPL